MLGSLCVYHPVVTLIIANYVVLQVIVADNFFSGSKDNLKRWIGHPNFELIRHGLSSYIIFLCCWEQTGDLISVHREGTFRGNLRSKTISNFLCHRVVKWLRTSLWQYVIVLSYRLFQINCPYEESPMVWCLLKVVKQQKAFSVQIKVCQVQSQFN
jgi:hypothetical protein